MSDLQLPDRLTQLRGRWEADPASRIFLQLAEEYRHLGRIQEALAVLEAGLKEHPGYLSALVAKGRCLLELGQAEPAREVLERVVRQDATQAVANKLLVRAYVETGQAERAKERLDLYSLLHDGDPEIEELKGRIRRLEGDGKREAARPTPAPMPPTLPTSPPSPPAPSIVSRESADHPFDDDPFSLPAARPAAVPLARSTAGTPDEENVFELVAPAPKRAVAQDVFALEYPRPVAAPEPVAPTAVAEPEPVAATAAPEALDEPEPTAEGDPFPGLVSRTVRHRYLSGLAAEGLFPIALAAAPAAPTAAPEPVDREPLADLAPAPAAETKPPRPPSEVFELSTIGAAVEAELRREAEATVAPEPVEDRFSAALEPELEMEPELEPELPAGGGEEPEAATVTLGDLYLRQGYPGEAERIFEEIVRREPDNAAAHEGLARIAASRQEVSAPALAPPAAPEPPVEPHGFEPPPVSGDRQSRKIHLLNSYLQRVRRGSQPDVS
jgi:tetratricopeptide (TPR) repeat protein